MLDFFRASVRKQILYPTDDPNVNLVQYTTGMDSIKRKEHDNHVESIFCPGGGHCVLDSRSSHGLLLK